MSYMIWSVIRSAAIDIWDEMLYLMIFNVIWVAGTALIIPWPFVTFGVFAIAYDVGQGKGIKFGTFFTHAARVWKQAYIWGGINIAILIILVVNLNFYANINAQWAGALRIVILGVGIFWFVLQLIALAIYPRLEEPGFKIATRNAAVIFSRYPLPILALLLVIAVVVAISYFLQVLLLLGVFSIIAVATNRMVEAVVKKELQRDTEEIDE